MNGIVNTNMILISYQISLAKELKMNLIVENKNLRGAL